MARQTSAPRRGRDAGDAERTPVRARGHATRARLLEAGIQAFSRRGFHATRVDDIVGAAKTSHGTFYLYFQSKDDLFDQLISQVAGEFQALAETLPEISATSRHKDELERWLLELIGVYAHYGPLIRSWTEADRGDANPGQGLLDQLSAALAARIKVRRRKGFDLDVAALAVVAMVERVNYFSATGQLAETPEELASTLADIVLDAIFGPGDR